MKLVNLLAAGLLLNTAALAQQYHTIEKVPIEGNKKLMHLWDMATLGDKLILGGRISYNSFGSFVYYNGTGNIQIAPNNIMNGAKVSFLHPTIENTPNGVRYFNAWDKGKGGIYKWDGITPLKKLISYEANGSYFDEGIWLDNKVYFTRYPARDNHAAGMWVFDVNKNTLTQLSHIDFIPTRLTLYNGDICYFNSHKADNLYRYNISTQETTEIATGIYTDNAKINIHYTSVLNGKLIFKVSDDPINGEELYTYDGNEVRMITNLAPGKYNSVGGTSQPYNGKIYFAGNTYTEDEYGDFNLYSYDPANDNIRLIHSFGKDSVRSGHPQTFYVGNNKLYFTAYQKASGQQVYEYDDATDQVTRLTNEPNDDHKFYPMAYHVWRGHLYFTSSGKDMPFNDQEVYRIDLSQRPTTVNTTINTPQVKVYPNPTNGDARIDIQLPRAAKVSVTLTDVSGRQVYEQHGMSSSLNHSITIPMAPMASGNYIYTITDEHGTAISSGKLTKQ